MPTGGLEPPFEALPWQLTIRCRTWASVNPQTKYPLANRRDIILSESPRDTRLD